MNTSEYLVVVMLAVFLLFGLVNLIIAPILARRFYNSIGMVNQGKSLLETPSNSVLLLPLATSQLYRGQYKGYQLVHCKAYPKTRRKFTLSKVVRKHNQSRWSVTRLDSGTTLPPFCLLPITDMETAFVAMGDPGIDLSDDKELEGRYHLRTSYPEKVVPMITGEIRKFLMARELISVECVDDAVIIKRTWPAEKIQSRLMDEIHCAVDIVEKLSEDKR